MQNEYLCHYGVKGMKWGVRKDVYRPGSNARIDNAVNKFQEWYNQPHGAANPSGRKKPTHGARKVWINSIGVGYAPASIANMPDKPTFSQSIAQNHINAWNTDPVGYTLNNLGQTAAKLRRTMRTNLYSPETKIQLGMQMTGTMLRDASGLVLNTPQGQAAVAVGAVAITAAMAVKRRRDEKRTLEARMLETTDHNK